jgi:cell wall assembly regulator SMI1
MLTTRVYFYTIKRARSILFRAILTSNCQQCICIDMSPTKVSKFMKVIYFDADITQNARILSLWAALFIVPSLANTLLERVNHPLIRRDQGALKYRRR